MGKSEQERCLPGMTKYSLEGPATCLCPGRVGVATAVGLYLLRSLSICPRVGDFHSPDSGKKFQVQLNHE